MGYLNELLSRNPLVIDGGTIRPHHNYTDDLYTGGKITMTNEEAINILKQNAICSPKATGFNRAVEVVTNEINRQKAEIENLNIVLQAMRNAANSYKIENERLLQKLQQPQSEAIKEFVERLKDMTILSTLNTIGVKMVKIDDINNLAQEMVGNADV